MWVRVPPVPTGSEGVSGRPSAPASLSGVGPSYRSERVPNADRGHVQQVLMNEYMYPACWGNALQMGSEDVNGADGVSPTGP